MNAGQLAADTDFFVSENAEALLNGTFGFLGLGRATEIAPFYPLAAPGAYFRARTADSRWEAHVGVYTADTGVDDFKGWHIYRKRGEAWVNTISEIANHGYRDWELIADIRAALDAV